MKLTKTEKFNLKGAKENYKLGLYYMKKGKLDFALLYFDRALRRKPDYHEVLSDKAALLAKIKEQRLLSEAYNLIKDKVKVEEKSKAKPEFQYTIPFYNLNRPAPPNHKRLFTFKCKAKTQSSDGRKITTSFYNFYANFTEYGIAMNIQYFPWHFISIMPGGFKIDKIIGAYLSSPFFSFARNKNSETKQEFKERKKLAYEKLGSLAMGKKKEMEDLVYNVLIEQPELRKKRKFTKAYPGRVGKETYSKARSRAEQE